MDDVALLRHVATVAGLRVHDVDQFGAWYQQPRDPVIGDSFGCFNPLKNDADAFRLVVRFGLRVDCDGHDKTCRVEWGLHNSGNTGKHVEDYGSDAYAASRRAITKAAVLAASFQ